MLFPKPIQHTPPPECVTRHIMSDEAPINCKYSDPEPGKRDRTKKDISWRRWDAGLSKFHRQQVIREQLNQLIAAMAERHHPEPWANDEIIMLGQRLGLHGYAMTNRSSIRERIKLYAEETGFLKTVRKGGRMYGYVLNLEENQ